MHQRRLIRSALFLTLLFLVAIPARALAGSLLMPPLDGFLTGCSGQYYNNTNLSGSPVLTRTDGAINFVWPTGNAPGPGVSADHYSVRWTCSVNAPSSTNYNFSITTDDGMNLIVDGNPVIWAFYDQGPTTYSANLYLNSGTHTVVVEYYNSTNGGTAQVSSSLGTGSYVPPSSGTTPPTYTGSGGYLANCSGQYYNNTNLSGSPVTTRTDGAINFVWSTGTSPAAGVSVDHYSVRWTCSVNAPSSSNYSFTMTTDDGMNLLVDGNPIIWAFYDQGPTTYTASVYLTAGSHTVVVEYYNSTNGGTAQVSSSLGTGGTNPAPNPNPNPNPSGNWYAEYYNNQSLSGSPTTTRYEPSINFNWGAGSPDGSIPADHFSARWTQTHYFNAGTWRFTAASDDGVRLWVDGTLLIDKWFDHTYTGYTVDTILAGGNHTVRLEYYDNVGAAAVALAYGQLGGGGYVPPPPPPPGQPAPSGVWHGQYFTNLTLSGAPAIVRDDAALNFNWYENAPFAGFPQANWSAKWDSTQYIPASANYVVTATSDDGVRVWVDGTLIIDAWFDHAATPFSANPYLTAGNHVFHVEYYQRAYGASIAVQIGGVGYVPPPPPAPGTGTPTEVVVDDNGAGWQAGGTSPWYGAFGMNGHSFWSLNHAYTGYGYNWAHWSPALTAPGNYEVFAYIPGGYGTTLNARYWVRHGNRNDLAVRGQGFSPNQWLSLGTYYFSAAGGEYVSLADVTYECFGCTRVAFDAVKFSPR